MARRRKTESQLVGAEVRVLKQTDVMKCPHFILIPRHYRDDGSCRCNDPLHAQMAEWGYRWDGVKWR